MEFVEIGRDPLLQRNEVDVLDSSGGPPWQYRRSKLRPIGDQGRVSDLRFTDVEIQVGVILEAVLLDLVAFRKVPTVLKRPGFLLEFDNLSQALGSLDVLWRVVADFLSAKFAFVSEIDPHGLPADLVTIWHVCPPGL